MSPWRIPHDNSELQASLKLVFYPSFPVDGHFILTRHDDVGNSSTDVRVEENFFKPLLYLCVEKTILSHILRVPVIPDPGECLYDDLENLPTVVGHVLGARRCAVFITSVSVFIHPGCLDSPTVLDLAGGL